MITYSGFAEIKQTGDEYDEKTPKTCRCGSTQFVSGNVSIY